MQKTFQLWPKISDTSTLGQSAKCTITGIVAFLEQGIQISNDQSVRRALGPLNQIAARQGCVFLLMRQLNKAHSGLVRYRGGGSIGFQGACRSTWLLERDPKEPERLVLAQVKNNLARLQKNLALTVASLTSAEPEDRAQTLLWHGPSPWSADQLLGAARGHGPRATETDRACQFLKKLLEDGPQSTPVIWEAGKAEGFSDRMLRRARDLLSIESARAGNGREHRAYWSLKNGGNDGPFCDAGRRGSRFEPLARPLDRGLSLGNAVGCGLRGYQSYH